MASGNVVDISGNIYPTIKIGNQIWMAENLRTIKYSDGNNIPIITSNSQWANNTTLSPMMCWYNNDQATYTSNKFGALYNWYAINSTTNGNKNVCPTGWHVPTDAEWMTLTTFLGGELIAGGKLKSTGTQYWSNPNTDATNSSGFLALPGAYRHFIGSFANIGNIGFWWSSTEDNTNAALDRYLEYDNGECPRDISNKTYGFSVRCVRD
jgi:uncharacterized protein (TIGR02145 family)